MNDNERHSTARRAKGVAVGLAGGTLLIGSVGVGDEPASAVYHTPWSRSNAESYALSGLHEKYDGTASHSVWSDDNVWNELGADCSGYVNKVWAVPYQRAISYDDHGPYSTWHWYNNQVDGSVYLDMYDSRTRKEDVWVFRRSDNTGHMGVFFGTTNYAGQWKVMHAKGSAYGIVDEWKPTSYFHQSWDANKQRTIYASKRYKRGDW